MVWEASSERMALVTSAGWSPRRLEVRLHAVHAAGFAPVLVDVGVVKAPGYG